LEIFNRSAANSNSKWISSCADSDNDQWLCISCGETLSNIPFQSNLSQIATITARVQKDADVKLDLTAYDGSNQSHPISINYHDIEAFDSNGNLLENSPAPDSHLGLVPSGDYEFDIITIPGLVTENMNNWRYTAELVCIPYLNYDCGDTKTIHFAFTNHGYDSIAMIQFDVPFEVTDVEWKLTGDISLGIGSVQMTYEIDDSHIKRADKNGSLYLDNLEEGQQYLLEVSKFIDPKYSGSNTWDSIIDLTLYCHYDPTNDLINYQEELEGIFGISLVILGAFCIIMGVAGYIDARFLRINDFYRIGAIFAATIQILDMLSDSFLAFDIQIQDEIDPHGDYDDMLYICIICIVVPALLSLFQVYYFSKRIWGKNDKAREWLIKYSKFLYIASVLTGSSFSAVEIMNSSIFGLSWFEMGLSHKQVVAFKTQRIYSVILLENVPQLVLQIVYMLQLEGSMHEIAICGSIFSAVSIIVTILSMTMEKSLIESQQYTLIKMDITGKCVLKRTKKCQKRVEKIRSGIATILGCDYALIEILKPRNISKGLKLVVYVYESHVDGNTTNINGEHKYCDLLHEAQQNGSLAECIDKAWKLDNIPNISNIKCEQRKFESRTPLYLQTTISNTSSAMNNTSSVFHSPSTLSIDSRYRYDSQASSDKSDKEGDNIFSIVAPKPKLKPVAVSITIPNINDDAINEGEESVESAPPAPAPPDLTHTPNHALNFDDTDYETEVP